MPFRGILENLVERVPGARGAVFVDSEGEYVELFSRGDDHEMKLAGAHQGIVLSMFSDAGNNAGTGGPKELFVRNDEVNLFARMLKDGYFVLLTTQPGGIAAQALRELRQAAREIEDEI